MAKGKNTAAAAAVSPGLSSIKLPPFWHNSPAAWFQTVEAQFVVRGVPDPIDRYYVVMAALSEQQSELVSNVLDEEPTAESYQLLKAALLSSHTLTPYQMVDKLVNLEPLGGRKPSQLMAAMQKLRPPRDEHFFIYHFLQRLPKEVRILLAHEDFSNTRKLAEKADSLMAIHQAHAPDVTASRDGRKKNRGGNRRCSRSPSPLSQHHIHFSQSRAASHAASRTASRAASRDGRKKNRGGNRRCSRSPSPFCHYHIRYGDKARNCVDPCAWPDNFSQSPFCWYHYRYGENADKCVGKCHWP
jgi:hypothetical protein